MSRKKTAALLMVAGIAITGGSAYTAGLTNVPATTYIGSGSTTVSGAAATTIGYAYDGTYTYVNTITAHFTGDIHTSHLWVTPTGGAASTPVDCGTGTWNNPVTDYSCDVSGANANWPVATLSNVRFTITS